MDDKTGVPSFVIHRISSVGVVILELSGDVPMLSPAPEWMCQQDEIDRAHQIAQAAGRTRQPKRAGAQGIEDTLDSELRRSRNARVMPSEGVQPVRIGGGDQWFAKARRHPFRAAIRIEKALVKVAQLNRIEAIDFGK